MQTCFLIWPCRAFPRVAQLSTLLKRRKDQIVRKKKASLNLSKKKRKKDIKEGTKQHVLSNLLLKLLLPTTTVKKRWNKVKKMKKIEQKKVENLIAGQHHYLMTKKHMIKLDTYVLELVRSSEFDF